MMVKEIAETDHLPDYQVAYDVATDMVMFISRNGNWVDRPPPSSSDDETLPALSSDAYEAARDEAPGYDIHALESEWREWWVASGKPVLGNHEAAFVGFCRAKHKKGPMRRETREEDFEVPAPSSKRRLR